jgi:predicted MPP superfamily phosphohydrolase
MAIAQCVIGALVLRHAWRRYSRPVFFAVAMGLVIAGAALVVGMLSDFQRFMIVFKHYLGYWNVEAIHIVAFIWCFSSTPAVLLYFITRWLIRRVPHDHQPERRKLIVNAGKAVVAAPFVVIAYGATVGRTDFRVEEVEIPVPNLPADLSRLRIVQLSDIHLSAFLSEQELARVIDMTNELRPDIALVLGDLISHGGDPINVALKQCARIRADRILGVLGNHERYAGVERYAAERGASLGINFLRSQAEVMRFGSAELNFGGVDYQAIKDRDHYLEGADALIRPGAANILLSHNPDVFPVAARQGWDVTLSGHTHGGQVTVEILSQTLNMARVYTPYVSGFYQIGRNSCYVTRGIGTIGIPARVGVPPEITSIRLVKGPSA